MSLSTAQTKTNCWIVQYFDVKGRVTKTKPMAYDAAVAFCAALPPKTYREIVSAVLAAGEY